jgi:hypothetical protein
MQLFDVRAAVVCVFVNRRATGFRRWGLQHDFTEAPNCPPVFI